VLVPVLTEAEITRECENAAAVRDQHQLTMLDSNGRF